MYCRSQSQSPHMWYVEPLVMINHLLEGMPIHEET
jgi:hypothetical protein